MKQLSNSNIIILPTTDEPILGSILYRQAFDYISLWRYKETYTYADGTKVFRTLGGSFEDWDKGMKHYHLYVLSDRILKENDYFLWYSFATDEYKILQYDYDRGYGIQTKNKSGDGFLIVNNSGNCGKITATTDKSLKVTIPNHNDFDSVYELPHPSEDLINKFVEDYNKEFKKDTFTIKMSKETTETLVYVLSRGLYEGDYSDMSDEDFKAVVQLEGRVYSLKDFQEAFNDKYCSDFEQKLDCIRFINVKV